MGIGSLLAKPISKAMVKPVAKQASRVVPEISQDVAESMATEATAAATPIATRARGVASPRIIREKEPALVQDVPEMEADTGLLRKTEETAPPISADPLFKKQVDRTEDFGVEPELIADSNADAFEALGLSAEKKEAWRKKNKTSQRSKLLPEIEEAAQKLFEGKLTSKEFRKLSEEKQPIVPLDEVPEMPSFEDIAGALTEAQVNKGIVGLNMKIPKGERVSSRLDIPAYNEYNTWVVSLHEGNKKSGAPIGYAKTAVLQNVEFVSDSKVALDIARRKPLGAGGRMGKATIARIFGDYVPHNPEAAKSYAEKIFNDPEWTQVGMNPYRASYFYDKSDNMPVVSADEVVQIGPLVMAKNVKKATPDDAVFKVNPKDEASPTFSKGGVVKNEYKTFAVGGLATPPQNILAEGGMLDDSGEMVNGTEVPAGSLAKEVADDVPAMLSEGEFVIPADVVRFIGLERLMKMRDKAKEGLERMEEVGQMGNAEEVSDSDQPFDQDDDAFESEIDSILAEDGAAMQTEQMFAAGGYVSGSDVSRATRNPAIDVRYFKHKDGRMMYITYINDKPMTAIPDGFEEVSAEIARKGGREVEKKEEEEKETKSSENGNNGRDDGDTGVNQQQNNPYAKEGVKGEFGINESGLPVSTPPDDPLYMARQKSDTTNVLAKVLPPLTLALGPLGLLLQPTLKKYLTAETKKAQDEELGLIGTQLSPFQQQGKVGELGDYKSVTSMVDQFGQNTAVMNGYFLAATDDFTSKVFNDLVEKSGAKDLTPAQVGVMGLAIDNAVKDKLAANPNMTLEQAQRLTEKEFVPDLDQSKIVEDAQRAEAQRQYDAQVAAQRQAEAQRAAAATREAAERAAAAEREVAAQRVAAQKQAQYTAAQNQARSQAATPSSWSAEQRQQAESSGMVNVGGVTVSNAETIRAQNEALFGPGTGDGSYSGGVSGHDYSGSGGASSDVDTSYGYGGYFAKGGFVRPRKKPKKK